MMSPWTLRRWPPPRIVRVVRGFLRLIGYYWKFIHLYGEIVGPLNKLLKREAFRWSPEVATTFESLKAALTSASVFKLPDFAQPFIVDCDASGSSIDAVLHQG
jgi:hypothetical protein